MKIQVSQDRVTFESIEASEAALVRGSDDDAHRDSAFGRSYDLRALAWARDVRIDGSGTGNAGATSGFDLDAIGAHAVAPARGLNALQSTFAPEAFTTPS